MTVKRTYSAIPRVITRPCTECRDGVVVQINGLFIRQEREEAHVTVAQAARACGVTRQHMGRMERGEETFQRGYAEICERLFAKRRRAGPE